MRGRRRCTRTCAARAASALSASPAAARHLLAFAGGRCEGRGVVAPPRALVSPERHDRWESDPSRMAMSAVPAAARGRSRNRGHRRTAAKPIVWNFRDVNYGTWMACAQAIRAHNPDHDARRHRCAAPTTCPPWNCTRSMDAPLSTEPTFKARMSSLTAREQYKTAFRRRHCSDRHKVRREREQSLSAEVLRSLRQGGWGRRPMAPRLASMTTLRAHDDLTIYHADAIGSPTSESYGSLFAPRVTDPTHAADELAVHRFSERPWHIGSTLKADVTCAFHEAPEPRQL